MRTKESCKHNDEGLGRRQELMLDLLRLRDGPMPEEFLISRRSEEPYEARQSNRKALAGLRRRGLVVVQDGIVCLAESYEHPWPIPEGNPSVQEAIGRFLDRRRR